METGLEPYENLFEFQIFIKWNCSACAHPHMMRFYDMVLNPKFFPECAKCGMRNEAKSPLLTFFDAQEASQFVLENEHKMRRYFFRACLLEAEKWRRQRGHL